MHNFDLGTTVNIYYILLDKSIEGIPTRLLTTMTTKTIPYLYPISNKWLLHASIPLSMSDGLVPKPNCTQLLKEVLKISPKGILGGGREVRNNLSNFTQLIMVGLGFETNSGFISHINSY